MDSTVDDTRRYPAEGRFFLAIATSLLADSSGSEEMLNALIMMTHIALKYDRACVKAFLLLSCLHHRLREYKQAVEWALEAYALGDPLGLYQVAQSQYWTDGPLREARTLSILVEEPVGRFASPKDAYYWKGRAAQRIAGLYRDRGVDGPGRESEWAKRARGFYQQAIAAGDLSAGFCLEMMRSK